MKEYTKLAAIVVIVILATTLLGASFQMINVRAQLPGPGSLFGADSLPGSNSGNGNAGTGSSPHTDQPVPGAVEPPLPGVEKLDTVTSLLTYDPVLLKGNRFTVSVEVTDATGKAVAGLPVYLYLENRSSGQEPVYCGNSTSGPGEFSIAAAVPAESSTGNYSLVAKTLETSRYRGSEDSAAVRVMAETTIGITIPANVIAGGEFSVDVTLTEKASRAPLPDMPVTIGAGLYSFSAVTDNRGMARASVSFPSAGNHTVMAAFEGTDDYLRSSAALEVPVAGKPAGDWLSQPGGPLLIILAFLAVIIMAATGVYYVYRKSGRTRKDAPVSGIAPARSQPVPFRATGYRLEFADIDAGLPAVWGAGEPLHIKVTGPQGLGSPVELLVDGEPIDRIQITDGTGSSLLRFSKGDHQVTIRADAGILAESAIRIVNYREEIVRLFNGMYTSLRSRFGEIEADVTPRELQSAVSASLSAAQQNSLDRIVSTFEIANYSTHTVGRDDYVKSFVLIQELQI